MDLRQWIRDVPDYPKPGILFRDLTPLLAHPPALRHATDAIADALEQRGIQAVCAIDARGFLFAAPVAVKLELPLIPLRKAGKLPPQTVGADYELEYGSARLEARANALQAGQKVAIVDDLLATGGTAAAAAKVVEWFGATVDTCAFVVELTELGGRGRLNSVNTVALVSY